MLIKVNADTLTSLEAWAADKQDGQPICLEYNALTAQPTHKNTAYVRSSIFYVSSYIWKRLLFLAF